LIAGIINQILVVFYHNVFKSSIIEVVMARNLSEFLKNCGRLLPVLGFSAVLSCSTSPQTRELDVVVRYDDIRCDSFYEVLGHQIGVESEEKSSTHLRFFPNSFNLEDVYKKINPGDTISVVASPVQDRDYWIVHVLYPKNSVYKGF